MIPQSGQYVSLIFRNGIQLDGTVVSWSDQKSVLNSASKSSVIVIQKTSDDILFYKIMSVKEKSNEVKQKVYKDEDDIRTLASLKDELNYLEKEELRDKISTHTADGMKRVEYGFPRFNSKIESVVKHTREEVARPNNEFGTELQNMFSKKR